MPAPIRRHRRSSLLAALALSACSLEHLDPVITGLVVSFDDGGPGATSLPGDGSGWATTGGDDSTTSVDESSTGAPLAECVSWVRAIEAADPNNLLRGLAADDAGNVVIVGEFRGDAVDFGAGPMNSAQGQLYVAKYGPDGAALWSRQFGPGGDALALRSRDVVFDAAGDVVVIGDYWGSLELGGDPLPDESGKASTFVVKLGPDGEHLWSEGFAGTTKMVLAEAVAADATGDVVVLMTASEPIDLGGGPVGVAGHNTLVARLADDGALVWGRALTAASAQASIHAPHVAFDPGGAVVITGRQDRKIDFGGTVVDVGAKSPVFVARLTADGAFVWVKHSTGANGAAMADVGVDGSGQIHLGGYMHGLFAFGGPLLVPTTSQNAAAVLLDGVGAHLWSERYGAGVDAQQAIEALAVNSAGERLVAGGFHGAIDLGGGAFTNMKAHPDVFVARQGPLGEHRWSRAFAGEGQVSAGGAAIDADGDAWIAGTFAGELIVGDQVFDSPAAWHRIYVTRLCADDLP